MKKKNLKQALQGHEEQIPNNNYIPSYADMVKKTDERRTSRKTEGVFKTPKFNEKLHLCVSNRR